MEIRAGQSTVPSRNGSGESSAFLCDNRTRRSNAVLRPERRAAGAGSTGWNVSRREWSAAWLPARPGTSAAARSEAGRGRRGGDFPRRLPKCAVGREGTGPSAEPSAKGNGKPRRRRPWETSRSLARSRRGFSLRVWVGTFKTAALPSPVATKTTIRAAFSTGRVNVMRSGGGFGESVMAATVFSFSYRSEKKMKRGGKKKNK